MKRGFGVLPPPEFEWRIGKNAASIAFVKSAETYLSTCKDKKQAKTLRAAIQDVKGGKLVLNDWLTAEEYLKQKELKMKKQPKQETHHGSKVWVNPTTESLRRTECLCFNCDRSKPGQSDHCQIASSLYRICVKENVAFALTRCPAFSLKQTGDK